MNFTKLKSTLLLISIVLVTIIAACSSNSMNTENTENSQTNQTPAAPAEAPKDTPKETVTLEFASNAAGATLEAYKGVVDKFNAANPQIFVEFVGLAGAEYTQLMNARMASNDLPDVFNTHGWAVNRYSEYLRPLNDQPWSAELVPEIVPIISNDEGELFALPFDVDISGMIYNETILNELGIEVPETWDSFLTAVEKVKDAGYTPIHIGGKDTGDVAGFISRLAASILVMNQDSKHGAELQDGSFDWGNFNQVSEFFLMLQEKEYFNVDHLTADKQLTFRGMAQNEVAFAFQSNLSIAEIVKLNPDAKVSMMRIPVSKGEPFLVTGERNAVGAWKDTKHEEEVLMFMSYLAQPENVKVIAQSYSLPAAFKNVQVDLGNLEAAFKKFEGAKVVNHFDREYLPNGMWSTLNSVGPGLLSGELNMNAASELMKSDYIRLREAE